MKKLVLRAALLSATLSATLLTAAPAFAQHGEQTAGGSPGVLDTVIWSLVGVGVFALVLGILYLFKRQVGAFPENPSWVAPISIQRSRDLPADDSHAHQGHADEHGHATTH